MKSLMRSSISGFAATIPMTIVMLELMNRLSIFEKKELPPKLITKETIKRLDVPEPKGWRLLFATGLMHFGFGAMAAIPAGQIKVSSNKDVFLNGSLYGAAVWAASYFGWLPAFGFQTNAFEMSKKRNAVMFASHLVWGVSVFYLIRSGEKKSAA